jgi:hypothetical protein
MSAFARYVTRKVGATVAVFAAFAVVAAAVAGLVVARGAGGSGSDDVGLSSSLSDPQALDAALADPASAVGGSTDPADPTDSHAGWQQLKADLKAARALEGDARRAALADIRAKAADGAYGDAIERRADRHQIRHELFFSLLPDNLQTDLTQLKDAPSDQREQLRADIVDKALAGDYGPEVQKAAEKLQALHQD